MQFLKNIVKNGVMDTILNLNFGSNFGLSAKIKILYVQIQDFVRTKTGICRPDPYTGPCTYNAHIPLATSFRAREREREREGKTVRTGPVYGSGLQKEKFVRTKIEVR
jgi:hypothetical protein